MIEIPIPFTKYAITYGEDTCIKAYYAVAWCVHENQTF